MSFHNPFFLKWIYLEETALKIFSRAVKANLEWDQSHCLTWELIWVYFLIRQRKKCLIINSHRVQSNNHLLQILKTNRKKMWWNSNIFCFKYSCA